MLQIFTLTTKESAQSILKMQGWTDDEVNKIMKRCEYLDARLEESRQERLAAARAIDADITQRLNQGMVLHQYYLIKLLLTLTKDEELLSNNGRIITYSTVMIGMGIYVVPVARFSGDNPINEISNIVDASSDINASNNNDVSSDNDVLSGENSSLEDNKHNEPGNK